MTPDRRTWTIGKRKPRSKKWKLIFSGTIILNEPYSYSVDEISRGWSGDIRIVATKHRFTVWVFQS